MAAVIGQGVSLRGIFFEDFQLPFKLVSGITREDQGKAVTLDTNSANTVKLAGTDDTIIGRLEVVEQRDVEGINVGTVSVKFSASLPIDGGQTINVGDTVAGSSSGKVKAKASADYTDNMVVEVDDSNGFVTVVKG